MRLSAAFLLLALGAMPDPVSAHGEPPRAMHGGLVQEAQELWLELVVKNSDVAVYVFDEAHRPVPASEISGTATVLVGGKSYKVELLEADGDRIGGKLPASASNRVVATVSLKVGSRSVSARFTGNGR